jgi:hypothetical protein
MSPTRTLLVGGEEIPAEKFLLEPVGRYVMR